MSTEIPRRCISECTFLAEAAAAGKSGMTGIVEMARTGQVRTVDNKEPSACPTPGPQTDQRTGRLACHMAFLTPKEVTSQGLRYENMPQQLIPFSTPPKKK